MPFSKLLIDLYSSGGVTLQHQFTVLNECQESALYVPRATDDQWRIKQSSCDRQGWMPHGEEVANARVFVRHKLAPFNQLLDQFVAEMN
jgi:hypothetical protein